MNSSNIHLNLAIIYGIVGLILFATNGPGFLVGLCAGSMVSNLVLHSLDNV